MDFDACLSSSGRFLLGYFSTTLFFLLFFFFQVTPYYGTNHEEPLEVFPVGPSWNSF